MTGVTALPNGVIELFAGGAGLWASGRTQARADAERVARSLCTALQAEWQAWGFTSSHADEGRRANAAQSFKEVLPRCTIHLSEVVGLRLDANGIAQLFLAKAAKALPGVYANPDPANAETHLPRLFLLRLVTRAYEHLLAEPGYIDSLAPALWQSALESFARIEVKIDLLVDQLTETSRQLGLTQGMVITLARTFATDVEDFDTARRELERAVGIAARIERSGAAGSNTGDLVANVLAEVAQLNRASRFAEGAGLIAETFEAHEAQRARLIEAGLEQAILQRDPEAAATWVLRQVKLTAEGAALFDALRAVQDLWFERGRDKGLAFDLMVSIRLAEYGSDLAADTNQSGTALNDLGIALRTLGEREPGTKRLEEAVEAYRDALTEGTRDRVPLQWAMAQMNLGNALQTLGVREPGTERLEEAVAAYRDALEERTRDRLPLHWAGAWGNMGSALVDLAERQKDLTLARQALAQLTEAEGVLSEGGHAVWAATFARQIPRAKDLIARLSGADAPDLAALKG